MRNQTGHPTAGEPLPDRPYPDKIEPDLFPDPPAEPPKVLYLTFDDGPSAYTPRVLELLARYNAKATFFVIGRQAAAQPELIERIWAEGHGLANHTWNHPSLSGISWPRFESEIVRTGLVLGERGSAWIRPPYGATDRNTIGFAARLGYKTVLWTVDPRDWSRPGANVIAQRVIGRSGPGSIVLMHDGGGYREQTVAALETILRSLSGRGYRMEPFCRGGAPDLTAYSAVSRMLPAAVSLGAGPEITGTNETGPASIAVDRLASGGAPAGVSRSGLISPGHGATVSGMAPIAGVADHARFTMWRLELLPPAAGAPILLALGDEPISSPDELLAWDSTVFADGRYQLRLRIHYAENAVADHVIAVTIANQED